MLKTDREREGHRERHIKRWRKGEIARKRVTEREIARKGETEGDSEKERDRGR